MKQTLLAVLLFAIAGAHGALGAHLAAPDSATLAIAGAGALQCWLAAQVLGASIASYAVAGFASLGVAAPRSWRMGGILAGAICSALLATFLHGGLS